MEHYPCHLEHPPPYEGHACIYGYCITCGNEHCAFDLCRRDANLIVVLERALRSKSSPIVGLN